MRTIFIVCFLLLARLSMAQTAAADNRPSEAVTYQPIPNGPDLSGVFEGRVPCPGIVPQLRLTTDKDCEKLKFRLELYHKVPGKQPSVFKLRIVGGGEVKWQDGHSYRLQNIEGRWHAEKGMPGDPEAEVFVLEPDNVNTGIYLWKGSNNVLFMLDEQKNFRKGNENFSYTLNRVLLVPAK